MPSSPSFPVPLNHSPQGPGPGTTHTTCPFFSLSSASRSWGAGGSSPSLKPPFPGTTLPSALSLTCPYGVPFSPRPGRLPPIRPALTSHTCHASLSETLRSAARTRSTCFALVGPPRPRLAGPAHSGPTHSPSRPAPRGRPSRPRTPPSLPGRPHRQGSSQAPDLTPL